MATTMSLDRLGSLLASALRPGAGRRVATLGARPERPLELYEFEACPFCRKVREAVSALDLEVRIFPCPKRGTRFRPRASELGGKAQFPYLVDPNTETALYESDEIVRYLFERYAGEEVPASLRPGFVTNASAALVGLPRLGRGGFARPSRSPDRALELWSFESSAFARVVRERLCELELPYRLHSAGVGSAARDELGRRVGRVGRVQVPFLLDPNTGRELPASADIVAYLDEVYAL
jgi:glutathione S-transferase